MFEKNKEITESMITSLELATKDVEKLLKNLKIIKDDMKKNDDVILNYSFEEYTEKIFNFDVVNKLGLFINTQLFSELLYQSLNKFGKHQSPRTRREIRILSSANYYNQMEKRMKDLLCSLLPPNIDENSIPLLIYIDENYTEEDGKRKFYIMLYSYLMENTLKTNVTIPIDKIEDVDYVEEEIHNVLMADFMYIMKKNEGFKEACLYGFININLVFFANNEISKAFMNLCDDILLPTLKIIAKET